MVVGKIYTEQGYTADIPEKLKEYVDEFTMNPDGETYTLKLSDEYKQMSVIRAAQGKAQLAKLGLYNNVAEMIEQSDNLILDIFWSTDSHWNMNSPTIQQFAKDLDIDLEQFFKDAKEIVI